MNVETAEIIVAMPPHTWRAFEAYLKELREHVGKMLEAATNPHELDMFHKGGLNMIDQIANARIDAAETIEAFKARKTEGPDDGLPEIQ